MASGVQTRLNSTSLVPLALSRHSDKRDKFFKRHICGRPYLTIQCLHCGTRVKILGGSRDRTCPACAWEIYSKMYRKYRRLLRGRDNLKMLTLTWKPVKKQNPEVVRAIGKAFVKLLHRKRYKIMWRGILAVIECKKREKDGDFYYHIHAIVEGGYIPQQVISNDWREISGFPVVWISKIRRKRGALKYVLKYLLKGSLFKEAKDREDFKKSMRGVRFVRTYGDFYNYKEDRGVHYAYPCPICGSKKCWVVLEFCNVVDLFENEPYEVERIEGG